MLISHHHAGDGVQTVVGCCEAMASVASRALPDGVHAGPDLQGWSPSGAERRVSPAYTTLDNNFVAVGLRYELQRHARADLSGVRAVCSYARPPREATGGAHAAREMK